MPLSLLRPVFAGRWITSRLPVFADVAAGNVESATHTLRLKFKSCLMITRKRKRASFDNMRRKINRDDLILTPFRVRHRSRTL